MTQETTLKLDGEDVQVFWEFEKGDPGVHTYRNGDPGYPPTPDCYYIEKVIYENKDITEELTNSDFEDLEKQLINLYDGNDY